MSGPNRFMLDPKVESSAVITVSQARALVDDSLNSACLGQTELSNTEHDNLTKISAALEDLELLAQGLPPKQQELGELVSNVPVGFFQTQGEEKEQADGQQQGPGVSGVQPAHSTHKPRGAKQQPQQPDTSGANGLQGENVEGEAQQNHESRSKQKKMKKPLDSQPQQAGLSNGGVVTPVTERKKVCSASVLLALLHLCTIELPEPAMRNTSTRMMEGHLYESSTCQTFMRTLIKRAHICAHSSP